MLGEAVTVVAVRAMRSMVGEIWSLASAAGDAQGLLLNVGVALSSLVL